MAETKTDQDPSIEEILESIRQIISDDGDIPAQAEAQKPAAKPADKQTPPAPDVGMPPKDAMDASANISADADVDSSTVEAPPEAEEEASSSILDLTDKVDDTRVDMSYDPDPPLDIDLQDNPVMDEPVQQDDSSLLSEKTADEATAEMAKLLASNVAVERDEPARIGRLTLEDMARDLMRPLIKSWLDQNLPRVIEKVVAKEMEKLARRVRDDD